MFMKKKGIKYAVAKDGEEAVQKWKAGSFHLVLVSATRSSRHAEHES
jgi:DNA-binding response OmpR family regulator